MDHLFVDTLVSLYTWKLKIFVIYTNPFIKYTILSNTCIFVNLCKSYILDLGESVKVTIRPVRRVELKNSLQLFNVLFNRIMEILKERPIS